MSALSGFVAAVSAVSAKELRGRMRGRRAFAVVSIYLLLLSVFAFGIYVYVRQQATLSSGFPGLMPGVPRDVVGNLSGYGDPGLSSTIGHSVFGGLMMVQTLLVLVLAPAFTSGAISLEREKQTLDLLVTTPLSTFGMVVGKLLSALTYVFLLIAASIPLASLVFVFGGVGPDDLVRGYLILFALAFGMGAVGLFISALAKRTQTSTVLTYVVVLALVIGSVGMHKFLVVATQSSSGFDIVVTQQRHRAPEALLWLNPFVADLDLVCTTAPGGAHDACVYMAEVTGRPYFGSTYYGLPTPGGMWVDPSGAEGEGEAPPTDPVAACSPDADDCPKPEVPPQPEPPPLASTTEVSFGFPRDTFWPKSVAAFIALGLLLTLASTQLVTPTRRLSLHMPAVRRRMAARNDTENVN